MKAYSLLYIGCSYVKDTRYTTGVIVKLNKKGIAYCIMKLPFQHMYDFYPNNLGPFQYKDAALTVWELSL